MKHTREQKRKRQTRPYEGKATHQQSVDDELEATDEEMRSVALTCLEFIIALIAVVAIAFWLII
jgi:hypothetical protein